MPEDCNSTRKGCVAAAAAIIGTKWTPQLLYMLSENVCRFGELQRQSGVNPRTLSARLDNLEACGIIRKTTYNEMPPRIEYTLTEKGRDLLPIIDQMVAWGDKHGPRSIEATEAASSAAPLAA